MGAGKFQQTPPSLHPVNRFTSSLSSLLSSKTMATFKGLKFQHLHPGHIARRQREREWERERLSEREMGSWHILQPTIPCTLAAVHRNFISFHLAFFLSSFPFHFSTSFPLLLLLLSSAVAVACICHLCWKFFLQRIFPYSFAT